jgi:hypothetical protein
MHGVRRTPGVQEVSLYSLLFFLSAGVDYSVRKRIFFADETRITIAFLLFLLGELLKKVINVSTSADLSSAYRFSNAWTKARFLTKSRWG